MRFDSALFQQVTAHLMINGVCLRVFELICYFKIGYLNSKMVHLIEISANDSF